jgi:MFS family permease
MHAPVQVYGYRWVVLAAFMGINMAMQTLWIAYAPITGPAMAFYGVSELQIGLLAMSFMIAFIPLSIPVSWVIDTYGFRPAVSIGAVMMAVFGLLRGMAGANYGVVMAATVGIAAAQPFLLNAWTKVAANWFAVEERATAVGLITLANLVGTAIGMALTPFLLESMTIPAVQWLYGGIGAATSVVFVLVAREHPPTPPSPPGHEARALMLDGLRHAFQVPDFVRFLAVSFVGLGIFNGLSTWIEDIVRPRGFAPTDAGTLGAMMLVGGLVGAVLIPALSDRQRKRKRWMAVGVVGAIPFVLGVAWSHDFTALAISSFGLGFFLTSVLPVGMQYAAEITSPTPEGTSNGLIQLFGQGSVVFVYVMQVMKTEDGSYTPSLLLAAALLVVSAGLVAMMKDPMFDA